MITPTDAKVTAAQELLSKTILRCLKKYGTEATLEAMSEQFGVTGASAVIAKVINPQDFAGVYVLRSIVVCDQMCKLDYIEGVL